MTDEIIKTEFDYIGIDKPTAEILKEKEFSIKSRTSRTIIENGRDLLEAKEACKHGEFLTWIEKCFPWSIRTADKMMQVAREFKLEPGSNLGNFQDSALYLLSAPSTPEPAREEAIQKAESGEQITHKMAKELKEKHKEIEKLKKQSEIQKDSLKNALERERELKSQEPEKVEVIPGDYASLKKQRLEQADKIQALLTKLSNLKEKQEQIVEGKLTTKLREVEKDFNEKQQQISYCEEQITKLRQTLKTLDDEVGAIEAYKSTREKVRDALFEISIRLQDTFEEYEMPEQYKDEYRKLANEMIKGGQFFLEHLQKKESIVC